MQEFEPKGFDICIETFNNDPKINKGYKIIEDKKVGKGGQAEVYCVSHENKKCNKVAKVSLIRNEDKSRETRIKLFENECKIYELLKEKKFKYSINEQYFWKCKYPNEDLHTIQIMDKYKYDLANDKYKKNKVKEVYEIINELHDKNVVHLDIKPQNFVVNPKKMSKDGIRVIDFGFSEDITFDKVKQDWGDLKTDEEIQQYIKALKAYDLFMFYLTFDYYDKFDFDEIEKELCSKIRNYINDDIKRMEEIYTKLNQQYIDKNVWGQNNRLNNYLNEIFGSHNEYELIGDETCKDLFNNARLINKGYEIKDEITKGGQGKIYNVCNTLNKCDYIAKSYVINNESSKNQAYREIEIYNELKNKDYIPNIITVFKCFYNIKSRDINKQSEQNLIQSKYPLVYLIMDKYDCTLDKYLSNPDIASEQKEKVIDEVLENLKDFHGSGYSHNDFKPNNIMVSKEGKPVIIDFGISKNIKNLPDEKKIEGILYDYFNLLGCLQQPQWEQTDSNRKRISRQIIKKISKIQDEENIIDKDLVNRIIEKVEKNQGTIEGEIKSEIYKTLIKPEKPKEPKEPQKELGILQVKVIDIY